MAIDYFAQQFGRDEDTAPRVMSDEELFQQTGSWEAAAALRDEQNNALNQYNWSQPAAGGLNLANEAGAAVTVAAPTTVASAPSYESVYDVFGGKDATNDLITQFRSMGLDDNAIASVFAPYQPVTATTTNAGALTQAATGSTTGTTAVDNTAVTGGLPATNNTGNVLSGNILAGASWNSTNNALVNDLTALTGLQTINTAVGGATSADTLNQLNTFLDAGGSFAPGSTVFLQTGGVDMLQGVDDATITNNINQIVSTLGAQGVNVVLTTSPRAGSLTDVVNNNFDTGPASFYSDIAANNSNVVTVDTMGQILKDKSLLRDALHTNAAGEEIYNKSVMEAYERLNPSQKIAVVNKVNATGTSDPADLAKAIDEVAGTNVAITAAKAADTSVTNEYFKANPDVAAAYAANSYGLTPEQFALDHYTYRGSEEGRKSPFQESSAFKDAIDLKNGTYLTKSGDIVDVVGTTVNSTGSADTAKLVSQILGQGTTSKWSGQGHGSAEANAADMAKILTGIGITDVKDFGKVPLLAPVEVIGQTYNGNQVVKIDLGDGKITNAVYQSTGQFDSDGNGIGQYVPIPKDAKIETLYGVSNGESYDAVDTSKVKIVDGKPVVDTGQTTFGNIKTGQAVPNTYSERQTGNAFGGTFAGSGNTGYRVDFSQGTPVFYTTGASSNDLVNLFADNPVLGAVANVAAGYFGGPAGVAALQAAMGKSVEDIAKGAVLAYVGGQIAGNISGSTELINSVGADAANVIGRSVGKYVSSEGKADIVQSLAGGAVDYGVNQITSLIPDFANLSQGAQDFTKTVVATTIKNGGDLSMTDLVDAAFTAGTAATKAATTGTVAKAIAADKTINDAVTAELDKQMTIDASGAMDLNAAAKFAEDSGYNKFTFDGKTYTLDNNNAANTITQLESDALTANTAANLKGGEFEGVDAAVAANAKANNTVIGNAEADNIEEAAYLAKQRNPTGTTFTFDGKTYTLGASNTAVTQALNETQKTAVLDEIKNAKTFNEAFATARAGLGAGQTFTWQGKEYSTATAAERPDLSTKSIDALNKANLATTTNASQTVAAQSDTAARATAAEELTKQQTAATKKIESTGFFSNLANTIQNQMKLSSEAANDYLKNNPNSPITNSVSTAYEAAGNLEKNVAGGIALLTNNKPLADAFVKSGDNLTKVGQSIGNGVVDTKNWNDTTSLIQNAQGWEKLGILAGRIMDGTSGLGRQVEVELRQELPGLFLGGGSVKGILVATGAMDTAETAGNAALETYDESIKKGKTHADALSDARKAGAAAGMAEAAVQLTLGKVADVVVGKIGNIGAKAGTKIVGEGVVEGGQEGGSSLAVNAILGQDLDVNKALTQTVLGGAVGKGTAVATSPSDIATTTTINNNITAAVTSGNAASVNTAITNSVQTSLSGGSSVEIAVGASVNSAITNGADAGSSITSAVSSAVTSGADVNQTVTASIDSAITAGANTTTAINSTVSSAITSGANVSQTVSGSITAATSAGVSVNTAVTNTVNSAVTASISKGADVATSVNSAVTSAITSAATSNANTTTAISSSVSSSITAAASSNANVTTAVDSAVNSAVTTAISSNVNANTAVTTAVDSAVTTALNSNMDATTAITTSVTAAINAAVNANVNANTNASVNANVNAAVNAAVAAAVNAGVDTNTAINAAVNAAVNANVNPNINANVNANINTNININIDELKKSATETATSAVEKTELIGTINDLLSGTPTATAVTPKTPTTKTSTKKTSAGLTAGLVAGAAMAGDLDRLPPQMLKAYMTQDKFVDPLAKLQALQEGMNAEKMPALPQVNTQEPDMPDQGNWKYGTAPDDLDSLFGEKSEEEEGSLGFKAGGYVAPLQMASGGAMPLPLLVKSGGALGALPRGDGRLDFRHGAHVAGEGDGQSDDIKAMLADGEFVFPADVVSALGNGSTKAGSDKLYEMMHSIRARARSKKPKDLPPPALKSPLDYLKKRVRS